MSSLIPLLHDLLPMIIPSSIHITKAEELHSPASTVERKLAEDASPAGGKEGKEQEEQEEDAQSPETEEGGGVVTRDAIVNKTDKMCAAGKPSRTHPARTVPISSSSSSAPDTPHPLAPFPSCRAHSSLQSLSPAPCGSRAHAEKGNVCVRVCACISVPERSSDSMIYLAQF